MFEQQGPDSREIADDVVDGLLGSLDGTVTVGEARGIALFFLVCCGIAFVVTLTMIVTGVPIAEAARAGRFIVLVVAGASIVRAVADILKIGRTVTVFFDLIYDIVDRWREGVEQGPEEPEITLNISTPGEQGHGLRFLSFRGETVERVVQFARLFLELDNSEAVDYATAERYYVGSSSDGKIWTRGDAQYAEWQEFKQKMIDAHWAVEKGRKWYITPIGTRKLRELSEQAREKGL